MLIKYEISMYKEALDNTKVDHIILEKILFDKLPNYKKINIFKK